MKTQNQYIDKDITSVELQTIKRGSHKVYVKWNNQEISSVCFSTKKEAQYYYNWITGNPSHPIHKHNKTLGL